MRLVTRGTKSTVNTSSRLLHLVVGIGLWPWVFGRVLSCFGSTCRFSFFLLQNVDRSAACESKQFSSMSGFVAMTTTQEDCVKHSIVLVDLCVQYHCRALDRACGPFFFVIHSFVATLNMYITVDSTKRPCRFARWLCCVAPSVQTYPTHFSVLLLWWASGRNLHEGSVCLP